MKEKNSSERQIIFEKISVSRHTKFYARFVTGDFNIPADMTTTLWHWSAEFKISRMQL